MSSGVLSPRCAVRGAADKSAAYVRAGRGPGPRAAPVIYSTYFTVRCASSRYRGEGMRRREDGEDGDDGEDREDAQPDLCLSPRFPRPAHRGPAR